MADAHNEQEPSIEEILASIREIISDEDQASASSASENDNASQFDTLDDDDDILDLSPFAADATNADIDADIGAEDASIDDDASPAAALNPMNFEGASDAVASIPDAAPQPQAKADNAIEFTEPEFTEPEFTEPEPSPVQDESSVAPAATPAPQTPPVQEEAAPLPKEEAVPAPLAAQPQTQPASNAESTAQTADSLLTESAKAASLGALSKLAQNIAISKSAEGNTLEDLVREMLRPMLSDWLDANLPPMIERMVERELERLVKQALDR